MRWKQLDVQSVGDTESLRECMERKESDYIIVVNASFIADKYIICVAMDYPTLPIGFHWAPLGWSRYTATRYTVRHLSADEFRLAASQPRA